jgi:4-hydroxyphenylacetate 3-monooxygenase
LTRLAAFREEVNAHLIATMAGAEVSPIGPVMPNQCLHYSDQVVACAQRAEIMPLRAILAVTIPT